MEAFAAGEIDVAFAGIAPATVWFTKGAKLKIVALTCCGGHAVLTMPDRGINSVQDLLGKKVAEPRKGSVTDTLMRAFILKERAGIEPDVDVELYEMKPADMPYALERGDVDAIITWEPYVSQAREMGAVIIFDVIQEWPNYPVNCMFVSKSFLDKHRELVVKLIQIHMEATDYINQHPSEANSIIAEHLGLPVEIIESARERVIFKYEVPIEDALTLISYAHELGYIENVPAPEDLFWMESPAVSGG